MENLTHTEKIEATYELMRKALYRFAISFCVPENPGNSELTERDIGIFLISYADFCKCPEHPSFISSNARHLMQSFTIKMHKMFPSEIEDEDYRQWLISKFVRQEIDKRARFLNNYTAEIL